MKYVLLLLLLTSIIFTSSCKKDDCLEIEDIVNTDGDGNILNQGNSNDWILMDISENDYFEALSNTPQQVFDSTGALISQTWEQPEGINLECPLSDNIEFLMYPNPVPFGIDPYLKITADKKFIDFGMMYGEANGEMFGRSWGLSSDIFPNPYMIAYELGGDILWPGPDNNVQVYLYVMTEDSCAYFTQGKIIYVQ